jgi:hypothetical protein
MGKKHVPELSFLADRSGRFQARIDELMTRSRKRQKQSAGQVAPAVPAPPESGEPTLK